MKWEYQFFYNEIVYRRMLVANLRGNLLQGNGKGLRILTLTKTGITLLQFLLHVQRNILLEGWVRLL